MMSDAVAVILRERGTRQAFEPWRFRFRGILALATLGVALFVASPPAVFAQAVEKKESIGEAWSIFCVKEVKSLSIQDCSLVNSVEDVVDSKIWTKFAYFITSSRGDAQIIIETPRIDYMRLGISLSSDGRQLGKAFVDNCDKDSCQSRITTDAKLLQDLGTTKLLSVSYPVGQSEANSLVLDFNQFSEAVARLQGIIGVRPALIAEGKLAPLSESVKLQIAYSPFSMDTGDYTSWGTPLKCPGVPATKIVNLTTSVNRITNWEIANFNEFDNWMATTTKACSGNLVVWVSPVSTEPFPVFSYSAENLVAMKVKDYGFKTIMMNADGGRSVHPQ